VCGFDKCPHCAAADAERLGLFVKRHVADVRKRVSDLTDLLRLPCLGCGCCDEHIDASTAGPLLFVGAPTPSRIENLAVAVSHHVTVFALFNMEPP